MRVRDVMASGPQVAEVTEDMRSVQAKLLELDVRHLPVVDRGRLVGIVSERELTSELIMPVPAAAATVPTRASAAS